MRSSNLLHRVAILAALVLFTHLIPHTLAATSAEVTKVGSNYVAKKTVGATTTTVYTGTDYYTAINTAINNLTPNRSIKEIVNIRIGGSSGNVPAGTIKSINTASYTILNFNNNTIHVNPTGTNYHDCIGIKADRDHNIEIKNVTVTGWPRYGFQITGCDNVYLSGINMAFTIDTNKGVSRNGIGIRADNITRDRTYYNSYANNLELRGLATFSGTTGGPGNNHGVETFSINNLDFDYVKGTDLGSCAVLLNYTSNATIGTINGTRCDTTGHYASFRAANRSGESGSVKVDRVFADGCGRGIFTLYSKNIHVKFFDIDRGYQGILNQEGNGCSFGDTAAQSYIRNSLKEGLRVDQLMVNNTYRNIALRTNRGGGIWETDRSGANAYVDVDARNGIGANVILGPGSTFTRGYR